jgi:hypothetical protein
VTAVCIGIALVVVVQEGSPLSPALQWTVTAVCIGLALAVLWRLSKRRAQPEPATTAAPVKTAIGWDDHFGISYIGGPEIRMHAFTLNGINLDATPIFLREAYFVSATTGQRLTLKADLGSGGQVEIYETSAIPPRGQITLRAEFPVGLTPQELLDQWGGIHFYNTYNGETREKVFPYEAVENTVKNFRPRQYGPRVTKIAD